MGLLGYSVPSCATSGNHYSATIAAVRRNPTVNLPRKGAPKGVAQLKLNEDRSVLGTGAYPVPIDTVLVVGN